VGLKPTNNGIQKLQKDGKSKKKQNEEIPNSEIIKSIE